MEAKDHIKTTNVPKNNSETFDRCATFTLTQFMPLFYFNIP